MAATTSYSVQYALRNAKAAGDHTPIAPSDAGGKLRGFWFTQTASAQEAGSTIKLAKIPANSRVMGIQFGCTDMGTSVTVQIGDSGDTDRLMAALDTATAAVVPAWMTQRSPTTVEPDIGFGYKYTTETDINITTAGATITGTPLIWGCIWVLVD